MKNVIKTLQQIVSSSDAKTAENNISDTFKQISPREAVNVRKDVQDFIDGKMQESELTHYLNTHGIAA